MRKAAFTVKLMSVLLLVVLIRPGYGYIVEVELDVGTSGVGLATFDGAYFSVELDRLPENAVTVRGVDFLESGFHDASLYLVTNFHRPILDGQGQQLGEFVGGNVSLMFSDETFQYELSGPIERCYIRITSTHDGESELVVYVERFWATTAFLPPTLPPWFTGFLSLAEMVPVRIPVDLSDYDWREPTAWDGQLAGRTKFGWWECPISCQDANSFPPWMAYQALDTDHNGQIDLHDFADFQACCCNAGGSSIPWECQNFDANGDGLIDVDDYEDFAEALGWIVDCHGLCHASWELP